MESCSRVSFSDSVDPSAFFFSKCGFSPWGKICLTFLGCLAITPTPPRFRPLHVEAIAGANTASKPCL
eukprot:15941632-Heterocapsa_arctica.AAC.1